MNDAADRRRRDPARLQQGRDPLQAYLPEAISRELRWSSLKWQPASFIDDRGCGCGC